MPKNQDSQPIEIKISTVVAISVILRTIDLSALDVAMKKMTGGAPDYFDHEFAVLDVASIDRTAEADWPALIQLFRQYQLNPVAVRGAPAETEPDILASGLSIDTLIKSREELQDGQESTASAVVTPVTAAAPAPAVTSNASTMIIDTPVRAGQRIYARGADLVVTAVVNNGAELIADGSIHVYAPLRGRALAGAAGNADARIFALSMEAELVSIAGMYRTFDDGLPQEVAKKPAQVQLAGDRISVLSIRA